MGNKPTLLEKYREIRCDFEESCKETVTPAQLWFFQELLYRIEVLEVFRKFAQSAPISGDVKIFSPHYKAVNSYAENLKKERDFPAASDSEKQKQRETASASFNAVIENYRKQYASYIPKTPEQYKKDIVRTIAAVLPAWVQYRNTINEIKINEENENESKNESK